MPKPQRKAKVLCARTDMRTYRAYRRAAAAAGLTLTDWIRERLREAADRELAA